MKKRAFYCGAGALLLFALQINISESNEGVVSQQLQADACDNRQPQDDLHTTENRAVDKAAMAAVKTSGIIQKQYPDLSSSALDMVAYRIIDEYLLNQRHKITLSDDERVCVKFESDLEITNAEIEALAEEYTNKVADDIQVAEIAEQVEKNTSFKANSLQDKKLVFIQPLNMWDGTETNHYYEFLYGLLSQSEYFYVTDDESIADYVITPKLTRAEVSDMDDKHYKMQISVELETISHNDTEIFEPIITEQNHFILFSSDQKEQEIADNMIRKLLTKASQSTQRKLDKYLSKTLEMKARNL